MHCLTEIGSPEGKLTEQHHMEDYTETPHITLLIVTSKEDFWGGILRSTALAAKQVFADESTESPVNNLYDPFTILFESQQILSLDISVSYSLGVGVVEGI